MGRGAPRVGDVVSEAVGGECRGQAPPGDNTGLSAIESQRQGCTVKLSIVSRRGHGPIRRDAARSTAGHDLNGLFSTFLPCVTKDLLYSSSLFNIPSEMLKP